MNICESLAHEISLILINILENIAEMYFNHSQKQSAHQKSPPQPNHYHAKLTPSVAMQMGQAASFPLTSME